jgi:hypothetical protein
MTGHEPKLTRKLGYLCTLLLAGRHNVHREQQAQRTNSHINIAAALALISFASIHWPLSHADCNVRLSRITALGSHCSPWSRISRLLIIADSAASALTT